jgi:flagellar biosynthesis protein FlhB
MAEGADQEDRTQAATPRRLQRAREEGQVPVSRELSAFAALAAATIVLMVAVPQAAERATGRLAALLAQAGEPGLADAGGGLRLAMDTALRAAAPFVLAALAAGIAISVLQSGFLLRPSALKPDLSRISPATGLKRLFGLENLVESGKSLAKLVVIGAVVWQVLRNGPAQLVNAPFWDVRTLMDRTMREMLQVMLAVLAAQGAIALLDVFWVRLRHARGLRMSREDIRQEHKESDGDPHVKQRFKRMRMQRGRKRMLAAVAKATVVLTNPTHYAVALAYDRARNAAPRVVAKGVDAMAARIREIAEENKVPTVANPPLARALYGVEVDTEIPEEHYQAVAEIIAYVWRLGQRARGAAR